MIFSSPAILKSKVFWFTILLVSVFVLGLLVASGWNAKKVVKAQNKAIKQHEKIVRKDTKARERELKLDEKFEKFKVQINEKLDTLNGTDSDDSYNKFVQLYNKTSKEINST